MSDNWRNGTTKDNDLSTVIWERLDPGRTRNPLAVMKYRRDDGWNDAPPARQPGDAIILRGTMIGALCGGVIGAFGGFFTLFLGVIAAGVAGTLIGSFMRTQKRQGKP